MFPKMNVAHFIGMSIVALSLLVTSGYGHTLGGVRERRDLGNDLRNTFNNAAEEVGLGDAAGCNSVQYLDVIEGACKVHGWFIGLMVVLVIVVLLGIGALVYKFVLRK